MPASAPPSRQRLIVQKYGGSSVKDPERIRAVARRIIEQQAAYEQVVVVVSAMGDTTDDLIGLAAQVCRHAEPNPREMDMLLTSGERIAMALLSMAVNDLGKKAISLTGSQVGILTDAVHRNARIIAVKGDRIRDELGRGNIVIVAGFQGFGENREITTLGRGGSDTTAVALAASMKADLCEVLKDVDGIFSGDPRIVARPRKHAACSYDEALELAYGGAAVLHPRCVEIAYRYRIPLVVRNSYTASPGTLIGDQAMIERVVIRGVSHNDKVTKVVMVGVPDQPGVAAKVFRPFADHNIPVSLIVQSQGHRGKNDVSFILNSADSAKAREVLEPVRAALGASGLIIENEWATLSVVGEGIGSEAGIASKVFSILADLGINIDLISSSSITITCVIPREEAVRAVKALHSGLGLDAA
ncbi:MAG: aspartate kinase [Planctomycetes bacterium]|nr:aspartate kinase [Planctomycetota bacterium]